MHVYFVRHGETDLNRAYLHQSPATPLNHRGVDQARTVAEWLRPTNATLLLTSNYTRARETARIIGHTLGLTPEVEHLFREVERPSALLGRPLLSPRSISFIMLMALFRDRANWRWGDAENFADIHTRIARAYACIEARAEAHDSIVVVSHSAFITLLTLYLCRGPHLSTFDLVRGFLRLEALRNTGVVHVEYVGPVHQGACAWILHPGK